VSEDEVRRFATSPASYFDHSWHAMQHMPVGELEELQLEAMRMRFCRAPPGDPDTVDHGEGVKCRLDRACRRHRSAAFQHSVYKSYPIALLLRNRFSELTRWLDRLTTHDLSKIDVTACDSIDSWLDVLDGETDLRVLHSSGTTGTMSFIPRSTKEWNGMFEAFRAACSSSPIRWGTVDVTTRYFNLIWPLYRRGRSAIMRVPEMCVPHLLGSRSGCTRCGPGG